MGDEGRFCHGERRERKDCFPLPKKEGRRPDHESAKKKRGAGSKSSALEVQEKKKKSMVHYVIISPVAFHYLASSGQGGKEKKGFRNSRRKRKEVGGGAFVYLRIASEGCVRTSAFLERRGRERRKKEENLNIGRRLPKKDKKKKEGVRQSGLPFSK